MKLLVLDGSPYPRHHFRVLVILVLVVFLAMPQLSDGHKLQQSKRKKTPLMKGLLAI